MEFVSATDLGDMMQGMAPSGFMPLFKARFGLGAGFNPEGGFAVVVVNLEKYGFAPDSAKLANFNKMPMVFFIAGRNVKDVFACYAIDEKTHSMKMAKAADVFFFRQVGDYIAISKDKKALDLIDEKNPSIDTVMTASQRKLMAANDMTFFTNCKTVLPYFLNAASDPSVKMDARQRKEIIDEARRNEQIDGLVVGLDVGKNGMSFTLSLEYKKGSELAEMSAAEANKGPVEFNRLPGGRYFMAVSAISLQRAVPGKNNRIISTIMSLFNKVNPDLSYEFQEKFTQILMAAEEQIRDVQFYVGRSDKGLLAISACFNCNSADVLLSLVPQKVDFLREVLHTMVDNGDVKTLTAVADKVAEKTGKPVNTDRLAGVQKIRNIEIDNVPDVAIVEGVTLSAVTMDISNCEISEDASKKILEIFGDEQIRALYGKMDEHTVVVTFGGGVEFAADAIKAAREGGRLDKIPEVAAALKKLPGNTNTVMLINLKNIFDTFNDIKAGCAANTPASKPAATSAPADAATADDESVSGKSDFFTFKAKSPVVISDFCEGNVENIRIDIPMPIFNDIISWFMSEMTKAAMEGKKSNFPLFMPGM
ncbi:MAG TPA: hypothetical protein PKK48_00190 [Phycisphaerae bacterium]|nr:hypothetical protein [Phycisphaerae bacterium]HPS53461.1 hypothetical protein [Phycisphaerae bacterium]